MRLADGTEWEVEDCEDCFAWYLKSTNQQGVIRTICVGENQLAAIIDPPKAQGAIALNPTSQDPDSLVPDLAPPSESARSHSTQLPKIQGSEVFDREAVTAPDKCQRSDPTTPDQGAHATPNSSRQHQDAIATPTLEQGLTDQDKLNRLSKRSKTYPRLWYTGAREIPRLLTFKRLEEHFREQTIAAIPNGWGSPQRFKFSEIEFVVGGS